MYMDTNPSQANCQIFSLLVLMHHAEPRIIKSIKGTKIGTQYGVYTTLQSKTTRSNAEEKKVSKVCKGLMEIYHDKCIRCSGKVYTNTTGLQRHQQNLHRSSALKDLTFY
jgi:hypothetical protein